MEFQKIYILNCGVASPNRIAKTKLDGFQSQNTDWFFFVHVSLLYQMKLDLTTKA